MRLEKKVPSSRLARFAKLTGLATAVSGNVIKDVSKQLLNGERPSLSASLLSTDNANSITSRLAQMRGAAMKLGQLLSMDAGELLPAEWEPILSRLRHQADAMPKKQLLSVLEEAWGPKWHTQFSYFSFEPIASASIGQVHRATLNSGEDLAIKVQYPGVRESIDSDIDNVLSLIKFSGALPKHLNIDPLIAEAKAQLKTEADYLQEATFLKQYKQNLAQHSDYVIPFVHDDLTTQNVLAMEYVEGESISDLKAGSVIADDICKKLMALTYIELFETKLMQSDPNFANFLYQNATSRIVLLDFGACRKLTEHTSLHYLKMAEAMQVQNTQAMQSALFELGLVDDSMSENALSTILNACSLASECLQSQPYNLKEAKLIKRIQEITMPLLADKTSTISPEFDVALVNRKITGMVLLANKLEASLDFSGALAPYLTKTERV